jgi:hypothetical protein
VIDWYRGVLLECGVWYLKNLHGWGKYSENEEWISAEYKKMEFGEGHTIPRLSEQSPSNRHSSDKKNATKLDLKFPISAQLSDSEVLSIIFSKDIVSLAN